MGSLLSQEPQREKSLVEKVTDEYLQLIEKKKKDYLRQQTGSKDAAGQSAAWKTILAEFLKQLDPVHHGPPLKSEIKSQFDANTLEIKLSTAVSYTSYYDYATSVAQNPFRFSAEFARERKKLDIEPALEGIPMVSLEELEACRFIIEQASKKEHLVGIIAHSFRKTVCNQFRSWGEAFSPIKKVNDAERSKRAYEDLINLIKLVQKYLIRMILYFFGPIIRKTIIQRFQEAYAECVASNRLFSADDEYKEQLLAIITNIRKQYFRQEEEMYSRILNSQRALPLSDKSYELKDTFELKNSPRPYENAIQKLLSMKNTLNPKVKFDICNQVVFEIPECIRVYYANEGWDEEKIESLMKKFDADSSQPILIYVVAQSGMIELIEEMDWMHELVHEMIREEAGTYSMNFLSLRETCRFIRNSEVSLISVASN